MNCQPPDERLLKDLIRRVKALEGEIGPWSQIMGVDTTPEQSIVPLNSLAVVPDGSNITFVLVWNSAPGEFFSVDMSTDATNWTAIATPLPAAEAPATETSFTSPSYAPAQRFWRVRRFPVAVAPCAG